MKKTLKLLIVSMMLLSSMLVFANTTNYNDKLKSDDVICAIGDVKGSSVNLLGTDENANSIAFYVNDELITMKQVNEYGWATCEITGLKQNTQYSYFIVSYRKDGTKAYSNVNKFTTSVKSISITEYILKDNVIEVTAIPLKGIGNMYWYLNGNYKGEGFSTKVGFKDLKSNTEYKIEVRSSKDGNVEDTITVRTK